MATKNPDIPYFPTSPLPDDGDTTVLEEAPLKVQPPQLYQVVLINDDYTPMEFVVAILQEYFNKDRKTATQIMLRVHMNGRGVCGIYTHDVANTKVSQVTDAARQAGHPLQCVCEPAA
jgi:ATP-dependent Clp protease adaptor protein ClpS